MEATEDPDTAQACTVSVLNRTAPDGPVRVDVAMRVAAHEYQGPAYPEIGSAGWWRRVKGLASRA